MLVLFYLSLYLFELLGYQIKAYLSVFDIVRIGGLFLFKLFLFVLQALKKVLELVSPLKEIADYLRIHYTTVSKVVAKAAVSKK